ncbi:MAG: hypothetical protein V3U65_03300 [Granulosicoccaceae bacterium]
MSFESQALPPDVTNEERNFICRSGRRVVIGFWTQVPSRCFVCNEEATFSEKIESEELNHIEVHFCEEHKKKRKQQFILIVAYAALCLAGLIVAGFLNQPVYGSMAFVAILFVPILSLPYSIKAKFKQRSIWIRGAGKEFLDSLPEYKE